MTTRDLDHLLDAAVRAAHTGGGIVAERFGRARDVEAKAPGDYVTTTDHASEEAIRDSLAHDTPDVDFFGEEQGGTRGGALGWLVDPLDGTANFLHAFPAVGVSVALVEDGRPVVGVVHAPRLGTTWTAVEGRGATVDGRGVKVSGAAPGEAICATGFPFKAKERLPTYMQMFEASFGRFEDLRRPGAASLDLAWVGEGVFDGFFELGLGPWDVAAGALVIREAGGAVTDWRGDDRAWLESGDILAGPPQVHEVLLDLAGRALREG